MYAVSWAEALEAGASVHIRMVHRASVFRPAVHRETKKEKWGIDVDFICDNLVLR
jgi:hypothetical protein